MRASQRNSGMKHASMARMEAPLTRWKLVCSLDEIGRNRHVICGLRTTEPAYCRDDKRF